MVFDPEGRRLKEVVLPAANPTCPTWGGKNFDILFVTTARDDGLAEDEGGNMFMFKPVGAKGQAKREFIG
jgi:sugar lactone lactonase YvrE